MQEPPARIVVKVNARQDRVQISRFAPGKLIGTLRTYRYVTPSSINRLFRALGEQLRPVEDGPSSGAWEADLQVCAPAPDFAIVEALAPGLTVITGNPKAAMSPLRRSLPPTGPYAPRPLYTMALYHRDRAGILAGERRFRCLGSLEWYRQPRRRARPHQFRSANPFGPWAPVQPLAGPADAPNCSWCGGAVRNPQPGGNRGEALCEKCMVSWLLGGNASLRKGLHRQPGQGRRANRARPVGCATLAQRLRESRLRPGSLRFRLRGTDALFVGMGPRRRTKHYLGPVTMRYLSRRRCLAAQCLRSGYRQLCAGVWYDPAGDVAYVQSGLSLAACAHIRKDAA